MGRALVFNFCFAAMAIAGAQSRSFAAVTTISPVITNPANGHGYQLLSSANWADSEAEAVQLGGHLTTVNNQSEQDFLLSTFGAYGDGQQLLWIGLYDPTHAVNPSNPAANYVWVDGSPVTYTNWDANEPNNANGVEFWVAMYYPNFHNPGSWNDWSDQTTDPIGIPINGVVEFVSRTQQFAVSRNGICGVARHELHAPHADLGGRIRISVVSGPSSPISGFRPPFAAPLPVLPSSRARWSPATGRPAPR